MRIKIDGMLLATFLTTIFYSATYPFIHKEVMTVAPDWLIAATQIINCVSVVTFGYIWNKFSDKLFKFYPIICILETVLTVGSAAYAICTKDIAAYYIIDTLVFALVTRNIVCGGVKLKAIRYKTETDREHFDNNNNSASAVATIIGSLIAMVLNLNLEIMLCIATFGNAIDNVAYILIYKSQVRKRKELNKL